MGTRNSKLNGSDRLASLVPANLEDVICMGHQEFSPDSAGLDTCSLLLFPPYEPWGHFTQLHVRIYIFDGSQMRWITQIYHLQRMFWSDIAINTFSIHRDA